MTAIEHYLEHHGWVRCDYVTERWERGDLLLDLDDPNHLAELARLENRSKRAVVADVMAFGRGGEA